MSAGSRPKHKSSAADPKSVAFWDMQRKRILVPRGIALLLIALWCAACGPNARTTALRGSLVTLNVARDTMLTVSRERETQIVEHCNPPSCSREEGHAQLDAWRKIVDRAAVALDDGYRLIYSAAILDDAKSLTDAIAAIQEALALLQTLKNPTARGTTP